MLAGRRSYRATLCLVSLAGQWEVAIRTPFGEQIAYVVFGDEGSGTARFGAESVGLTDVSSTGNDASWTVSLVQPITASLRCTVTLDGDTMSGTANAGFLGSFPLVGRRVAA